MVVCTAIYAIGSYQRLSRGFWCKPSSWLRNCRFDYADPFEQISSFHSEEFEAEASVSLFVECFKTHGLLEADLPSIRQRDEAQVP